MKKLLQTIVICLASGIVGAVAYQKMSTTSPKGFNESANGVLQAVYASQPGPTISRALAPINEDFIKASALSSPTVVFIKTVSQQNGGGYFDWFFNWGSGRKVSGSGSGVIYSADGYIMTNNHVIDDAENIEVIISKRSYKAKVVGTDPSSDLAVLKIDAESLPAIKFADSRKVRVGEWVLAVGNPFNLNSTVTAGIVSAKGRILNIVNSQFPIESFIQTDAAINPGNSGGALVNLNGELIGINTAIQSQTGSYAGYGFAVPSDIVAKVVNDLIKYGEVQKVFFGGDVVDLSIQDAEKQASAERNGVLVAKVSAEGGFQKAGLEKGDVIVKVNESAIDSKAAFDEELSYYNPGDKVKIAFKRNGSLKETNLTLYNREGTTSILKREVYSSGSLGAQLEVVSKVERERFGLSGGVKVVKFISNGILRQMGLESGTIITSINNQEIKSPKDLEDNLKTRGRLVLEAVTPNGQKIMTSFYLN